MKTQCPFPPPVLTGSGSTGSHHASQRRKSTHPEVRKRISQSSESFNSILDQGNFVFSDPMKTIFHKPIVLNSNPVNSEAYINASHFLGGEAFRFRALVHLGFLYKLAADLANYGPPLF